MGYPLDSRIPGYRQAYDIPNGGNLKVRSESWSPTYSVGTTNPGPRDPTTQLYRGCKMCLPLGADTDQFCYHLGAFRTLRIFGNIRVCALITAACRRTLLSHGLEVSINTESAVSNNHSFRIDNVIRTSNI